MITTKLAKKVLKKAEQKHLTEMGIYSMAHFLEARQVQLAQEKATPSHYIACYECRVIARKLGIEGSPFNTAPCPF